MMPRQCAIVDDIENRFIVRTWRGCCSTKDLANDELRFEHSLWALSAEDVKFYHSTHPHGSHQESKSDYSGKHHLHDSKTKVSVSPNGLAVKLIPTTLQKSPTWLFFGLFRESYIF